MILPLGFGLGALLVVALAVFGVVLVRDKGLVWRFEEAGAGAGEATGPSLPARVLDALGRRLGPSLLRSMGEEKRAKTRRRLDAGGRPQGMDLTRYSERKAGFLALMVIVAILFALEGQVIAALPCLLIGWIYIDIVVDRAARFRQAAIDHDLPDFLDILAVTVNAGIAFRPGMARVADAVGGPLGEEMTTTLRQMSLGSSRRQAFEALRTRNTSDFLGQFVSALLQAEELGVPLSESMVDLAREMRRSAYQRARRRAQRAAPRVSLIITSLVVPASMILIFGGLFLGTNVHFGRIFGS